MSLVTQRETGRQRDGETERQIFTVTDRQPFRKAGSRADRHYRSTTRCHTSLQSGIVPNSRLPARSAPLAASETAGSQQPAWRQTDAEQPAKVFEHKQRINRVLGKEVTVNKTPNRPAPQDSRSERKK